MAGVDSADGNLSKQIRGLADTFCGRVMYAMGYPRETSQSAQKNSVNTRSNNLAEILELTRNEKVRPRLHLTGVEGEGRTAMTRDESATLKRN